MKMATIREQVSRGEGEGADAPIRAAEARRIQPANRVQAGYTLNAQRFYCARDDMESRERERPQWEIHMPILPHGSALEAANSRLMRRVGSLLRIEHGWPGFQFLAPRGRTGASCLAAPNPKRTTQVKPTANVRETCRCRWEQNARALRQYRLAPPVQH
jgi:hypothetical protein